jgi:hypothetical protein
MAYNLQPPSAFDHSSPPEELIAALYKAMRPTELVHGMPPRGELSQEEYTSRLEPRTPRQRETGPAVTGLVELSDDDDF